MSGPGILIVDDEQDILELAVGALEGAGYAALPAVSSDIALVLLEQRLPFELLVTDVVLDGYLDGFALARKARELRPDIRIIYMTGYAGIAGIRSRGAPYGEVLAKPWKPADLVRAVDAVMACHAPRFARR